MGSVTRRGSQSRRAVEPPGFANAKRLISRKNLGSDVGSKPYITRGPFGQPSAHGSTAKSTSSLVLGKGGQTGRRRMRSRQIPLDPVNHTVVTIVPSSFGNVTSGPATSPSTAQARSPTYAPLIPQNDVASSHRLKPVALGYLDCPNDNIELKFSVIIPNSSTAGADKKGSISRTYGGDPDFQNFFFSAGLRDMGFMGPQFTWSRGNFLSALTGLFAMLIGTFPTREPSSLTCIASSRIRPLLISIGAQDGKPPPAFSLSFGWLSHEGFGSLFEIASANLVAPEALKGSRKRLLYGTNPLSAFLVFKS
ncbi:hypothetical protein K2173_001821 [Erythroxylum novogranatense]|uniref:Uncharacterized protein n=1 Tax=Erythroxylum novogranatense TaxID=1862640 RepID=A0AAV8S5Z7_9ROSI|nr:hypothetical protein K2173_001821 [Erythroxylum novogranatense]